jgi:hypothetical protein
MLEDCFLLEKRKNFYLFSGPAWSKEFIVARFMGLRNKLHWKAESYEKALGRGAEGTHGDDDNRIDETPRVLQLEKESARRECGKKGIKVTELDKLL